MSKFLKEKSSAEAVRACFGAIDGKQIDTDDFRWAMIDLGYNLSKQEATEIVNHFDASGADCLQCETFISQLC